MADDELLPIGSSGGPVHPDDLRSGGSLAIRKQRSASPYSDRSLSHDAASSIHEGYEVDDRPVLNGDIFDTPVRRPGSPSPARGKLRESLHSIVSKATRDDSLEELATDYIDDFPNNYDDEEQEIDVQEPQKRDLTAAELVEMRRAKHPKLDTSENAVHDVVTHATQTEGSMAIPGLRGLKDSAAQGTSSDLPQFMLDGPTPRSAGVSSPEKVLSPVAQTSSRKKSKTALRYLPRGAPMNHMRSRMKAHLVKRSKKVFTSARNVISPLQRVYMRFAPERIRHHKQRMAQDKANLEQSADPRQQAYAQRMGSAMKYRSEREKDSHTEETAAGANSQMPHVYSPYDSKSRSRVVPGATLHSPGRLYDSPFARMERGLAKMKGIEARHESPIRAYRNQIAEFRKELMEQAETLVTPDDDPRALLRFIDEDAGALEFVEDLLDPTVGNESDELRRNVQRRDVRKLNDGIWLNDTIINEFCALISKRETAVKTYAWNSFFYTSASSDLSKVRRWAKKRQLNVFDLDSMLVPINVGNNHWAIAVCNFKNQRFEYYDSLYNPSQAETATEYFDIIRGYLAQEWKFRNPDEEMPFDPDDFEEYIPSEVPQQHNGCDCGVFMLCFADFVAQGIQSFTFDQSHMPSVRKRLVWEVAKGELYQPKD
eukprot:Clim_evm56s11 gene=Clim_evmTU56s11